jgi:hypothetical protein
MAVKSPGIGKAAKWVASATLAVMTGTVSQPAHAYSAGAVSLMAGSMLTMNGLDISVTSCTYILMGTSGSCSAAEMLATNDPTSLLKIQGANGADLFSVAAQTGLSDITVTLHVQNNPSFPHSSVNQVSLALAGSITGGHGTSPVWVSTGENSAVFPSNMSVNLASPTASTSFTNTQSFNITKDLKVNSALGAAGDTLKLSYVTQGFLPAPEPVSVGIFLVGLAGLGAARRLRQSRTSQH